MIVTYISLLLSALLVGAGFHRRSAWSRTSLFILLSFLTPYSWGRSATLNLRDSEGVSNWDGMVKKVFAVVQELTKGHCRVVSV